ncbi:jg1825 [Pararge aegeria aegeria]|uniref:Jg1825 protein n=1 Tax=Pararge aegeria aegeria TaxID=348720 RepID=A0A8S4QCN1_9NEOP|nr:jg1825 [Pararge aegeria aegeria]
MSINFMQIHLYFQAEIVQDLKFIYDKSFNEYLSKLSNTAKDEIDVKVCLEKSIMHLDEDLSREVVEPFKENGTMTEDNEWVARKITKEHNTENFDELKRIWNEHPDEERKTVIRRDRLLGELAPLRSLGDCRYKWKAEILSEVAVPLIGQKAIPANYYTPPYLTAKPDVYYHRLTPKDKFLIIASDGLWDMMTPLQSVKLVGEHMKGKVFFNPLQLPKKNIQLGDINELLLHRKESLKSKPKDRNAATHLIRHAIGGTEYGIDHSRLAHLLSLSSDVSRMFRDDMTVTIVYFDSEFLRQCPA